MQSILILNKYNYYLIATDSQLMKLSFLQTLIEISGGQGLSRHGGIAPNFSRGV